MICIPMYIFYDNSNLNVAEMLVELPKNQIWEQYQIR